MNAPASPTTFLPVTTATRRRLEALVENLLALLDEIDGDVDLEDGADDEPSLGWSKSASPQFDRGDDREAEDEHDEESDVREDDDPKEDGGDDEPELGWTVNGSSSLGRSGDWQGVMDGEQDGTGDDRPAAGDYDGSGRATARQLLQDLDRRWRNVPFQSMPR